VPADADPRRHYTEAVLRRAANDLGRPVPTGTTVVGASDRDGSTTAVVYPLDGRTIVWCAPALVERLAPLGGEHPASIEEVVAAAEHLGGSFVGAGRHRVMRGSPRITDTGGHRLVTLDRDEPDDRARLAAFVSACPPDDLDEAELDMDDLDPAIAALVDREGAIVAYASARPWDVAPEFDDIAVITRPDRRGLGLAAAVVGAFSRRRLDAGRLLFYNCDVENTGSNAVAERVGFELVCSVGAIAVG
jgi:hypothetical protein